jgi:hypothetical protein
MIGLWYGESDRMRKPLAELLFLTPHKKNHLRGRSSLWVLAPALKMGALQQWM